MKINTNWCTEDGYNQERLHAASEFVASFRRKWNEHMALWWLLPIAHLNGNVNNIFYHLLQGS